MKILFLYFIYFPLAWAEYWLQSDPQLIGYDAVPDSNQGNCLALSRSGDTVAVSGYSDNSGVGATWIYSRTGGIWSQQGPKLVGSGGNGTNVFQGTGVAISSSGNLVAVGAWGDSGNVGKTWIWQRNASQIWIQQTFLVGNGAIGGSRQGYDVSLDDLGDTVAIGGPLDNTNIGATWIFTQTNGIWTQQGNKLLGQPVSGSASNQGRSVSLSGDGKILAVGGDGDGGGIGAAWIFIQNASGWFQQAKVIGSQNSGNSHQGHCVRLSNMGDTVAIGGYNDANGLGAVWIFVQNGSHWIQQGAKLVGNGYSTSNVNQGYFVALSGLGDILASGSIMDDLNIGAVWIFLRQGGIWNQQGPKLVGNSATSPAYFGGSVALDYDGDVLAVGGFSENGNAGAVWMLTPIGCIVLQASIMFKELNYVSDFECC